MLITRIGAEWLAARVVPDVEPPAIRADHYRGCAQTAENVPATVFEMVLITLIVWSSLLTT